MRAPAPATPAQADLLWPSDRPELLPFLPLIYVAWADGCLTDDEVRAVRARVDAQEWLSEDDREALCRWLRPDLPPSPASLGRLRERLRQGASSAGDRSLVELGVDLARQESGKEGAWSAAEARAALEELEHALGVVGEEAARSLVGRLLERESPGADSPDPGTPGFDVASLRRFLGRPHPRIRRRVLTILEGDLFRPPLEIGLDAHRERTLRAVRRLAAEGLGSLGFPEEFGGAGAPGQAIAAFETLALGDLSVLVKFGVHFGLFGGSVYQLGTEKHHRRYLRDIGTLELPGCFAMTELAHGSNVRDIETTAVHDPETDEIVIHTPHDGAGKHWIGNAARDGRMATVFAQLRVDGEDHGVHAILVPIRGPDGEAKPGVRIEDCGVKVGLNGVDNGRLWFDSVRVPRENLLDRFARITDEGRYESPINSPGRRFFTMLGTLVAGRISIAAASVSAAKIGLTTAIRYSARRRQFGPSGREEMPVLEYLMQQRLLLPRLAESYGLHFAVRSLASDYASLLERGRPDEEARKRIEIGAAGLKAYASRHCLETLQAGREALGGQGYLAANRFGRLREDTDVFTTFEGANVVLLQLVARGLLSEYGQQMGDLRMWDLVRVLADRAGTRVKELNPVVTRRTDEEHLRDPDFHRAAFEYREQRLLGSVARRLDAMIGDGVDSFVAMNRCQDHLVRLARAHVETTVLAAFRDAVKRAPDPGLSEVLQTLATLWALERVEAHRGWYLESGYVEAGKSKAVRSQVDALCGEVAEEAVFLVDGFGIPDAVLGAPDGLR